MVPEHHFGIVMEYASKGQLFEYVRERYALLLLRVLWRAKRAGC